VPLALVGAYLPALHTVSVSFVASPACAAFTPAAIASKSHRFRHGFSR
jgi:hypothetical protein